MNYPSHSKSRSLLKLVCQMSINQNIEKQMRIESIHSKLYYLKYQYRLQYFTFVTSQNKCTC